MRLRAWGGLAHIQEDSTIFEKVLPALGLPSLKAATKGCRMRLGGVIEIRDEESHVIRSHTIRRRDYSVRVFLERERRKPDGEKRFLRRIPVYLLHVSGLPQKPVWTAAELFCLLVTGRIRVVRKKEHRIAKRRIANGASLTWWLLLLWKAGLLPALRDELTLSECSVEKAWRLLWHLRNIAMPGKPVKFSVKFARSLCGGSVLENRSAIHHLRERDVMRVAEENKNSGFAYVMGDGSSNSYFLRLPLSRSGARRVILRGKRYLWGLDRQGHLADLTDRQRAEFEATVKDVLSELTKHPLENSEEDLLDRLRAAYREAWAATGHELMSEVMSMKRRNSGGNAGA